MPDRADQLIDATAGTTTAFAYDPYGSLTTSRDPALGATTYTYDAVGHLATIVPPAGPTIALHTDALGRVRDRTTTSTDTYAYVGSSDTAYGVTTAGGTTTAALVDPAGGRLGLNTAGTVRWSLADLHGSTAALAAAASAAISDAYRYDGWGRTVATAGSAQSPWRYRGLVDLGPAGDPLYAMGVRFYSPGLGTFTQLDTYPGSAADPLGLNRYLYAEANPATLVDPDGHRVCETDPCASYTDTRKAGASVAQSGGTGPTISPYVSYRPGKDADDRGWAVSGGTWTPPPAASSSSMPPAAEVDWLRENIGVDYTTSGGDSWFFQQFSGVPFPVLVHTWLDVNVRVQTSDPSNPLITVSNKEIRIGIGGATLNIDLMYGNLSGEASIGGWSVYDGEGKKTALSDVSEDLTYYRARVVGSVGGEPVFLPPGYTSSSAYQGETRLVGPEFSYSVTTSVVFNYAVHPQTWTLTPLPAPAYKWVPLPQLGTR